MRLTRKPEFFFVNGKAKEFVTQNDKHHVYYVFLKGKQTLKSRILKLKSN